MVCYELKKASRTERDSRLWLSSMVQHSCNHFSAPSTDTTFQAIYFMLYILCVWVLLRRKRNGFMWQLISSTLLFSLETANLALGAAYVLCHYFIELSIADNWPDRPYQTFQLNRIYTIIYAAVQGTNLLCLCVQVQTSDVVLLKFLPE
jgi:hypothetical protein